MAAEQCRTATWTALGLSLLLIVLMLDVDRGAQAYLLQIIVVVKPRPAARVTTPTSSPSTSRPTWSSSPTLPSASPTTEAPTPPPSPRPTTAPTIDYSVIRSEHVSWTMVNHTLRLLWHGALVHVDHAKALRCLAGVNLTFMGDSRTRYQYLNLVYFLTTGNWTSPFPANEQESQHGTQYSEGDTNWSVFYNTTSTRLTSARTFEVCDCARQYAGRAISSVVENRYWTCDDPYVNVNLMTTLGPHPLWYHKLEYLKYTARALNRTQQAGCRKGHCAVRDDGTFYDYGNNYEAAMVAFPRLVRSTHVMLARGWNEWSGAVDMLARVATQLRAGNDSSVRRVFYRSASFELGGNQFSTPRDHPWMLVEYGLGRTLETLGYEVYNASLVLSKTLMREFRARKEDKQWPWLRVETMAYWDSYHFTGAVNRAFNELLLHQLVGDCLGAP